MSLSEFKIEKQTGGKGDILRIVQPPGYRGKLSENIRDALRDFYGERGFPIVTWQADQQKFYDTKTNGSGIIHVKYQIFKEQQNNFNANNFYGIIK